MARTPVTQQHIIDVLKKQHLLSAVQIQAQLEKLGIGVNKTTVYRALEKLLDAEVICRHSLGTDTLLYELRNHHHDHAVCEQCHTVQAIECQETHPIQVPGFQVTHHHKTVFGVCSSCQTHDR